jgi:hypothetical protein
LGTRTGVEECEECFVVLIEERTVDDCETCDEILSDFLRFMIHEGDRPYDDPAPTFIAISNQQVIPTI